MIDRYCKYFQYDMLASISVVITILPLIILIKRKAYVDPAFRLLAYFLATKLVLELIMFHYASYGMNNLLFQNTIIVFRYTLLSGMFYHKFENPQFRKLVIPVAITFLILTAADILSNNTSITDLHNHRLVKYAMTIESVLMIVWVLLYFYDLISSLKIPSLLTFPFFWVCSGLLIFYSSLVFVAPALFYQAQWNKMIDLGLLDRVPYIFEIVCILLITTGTWVFSSRYYARQ
jgi:hypothetical protein